MCDSYGEAGAIALRTWGGEVGGVVWLKPRGARPRPPPPSSPRVDHFLVRTLGISTTSD